MEQAFVDKGGSEEGGGLSCCFFERSNKKEQELTDDGPLEEEEMKRSGTRGRQAGHREKRGGLFAHCKRVEGGAAHGREKKKKEGICARRVFAREGEGEKEEKRMGDFLSRSVERGEKKRGKG